MEREKLLIFLLISFESSFVAMPAAQAQGKTKVDDIRAARRLLELKLPPEFNPNRGAFSPDGRFIAVGESRSGINDYSGPQIMIWDAETGMLLHKLRAPKFFKQSGQIHVLSFSPNSEYLLTSGIGGAFRLWSIQTGRNVLSVKPSRSINLWDAVFSPDGKTIATMDIESNISIWNSSSGRRIGGWTAGDQFHSGPLVFFPDGKTLVSGSDDGQYLWDLQSSRLIRHIPNPAQGPKYLQPFAVTSDGKTLVSYGYEMIITFDTFTGKEKSRCQSGKFHHHMIFSQDGKTGLSDTFNDEIDPTDYLAVWDVPSSKLRYRFKIPFNHVSCLALSRDGHRALVGSETENRILVFQLPD